MTQKRNKHLIRGLLSFISLFLFVFNSPDLYAEETPKKFNVGYQVLDFKYKKDAKEKTLTVAVWYPTLAKAKSHTYGGTTKGNVAVDGKLADKAGSYPLLVFSHGYGGGGLASVFFTEQLASRGWIVVAPDHHDKYSAVRIRGGQQKFSRLGLLIHAKQISTSTPADRKKYLYRLDEMQLSLDSILKHPSFGKVIDKEKIAVGGHSFGGYTALGLCGSIEKRHDKRIKAVLLFSTGAGGYLFTEDELKKVKMPSMLFRGELEKDEKRGKYNMVQLSEKIYKSMSAPKYFLEIKGGTHFSFNNRFSDTKTAKKMSGTKEQFRVISLYSTAFLEKHIAHKKSADKVLEQKDKMLTSYLKDK